MKKREEIIGDRPPAPVVEAAALHEQDDAQVLVVLDDDPTGTQSVADLPVLLGWATEDFEWAFGTGAPAVYVMTNSSSLAPGEAARINRCVEEHDRVACDAVVIVPAFPDARRITVDSVDPLRRVRTRRIHPCRRDRVRPGRATFGYRKSDLRQWVQEVTEGRFRADQALALDLETIRRGPDAVVAAM